MESPQYSSPYNSQRTGQQLRLERPAGPETVRIPGKTAVKKPGSITMPAERRLTVLEAITLAGGFTDLASPDRTKVLRNANGQNQ
ncbi:MAG: SLBB domain-containing protein, partial [Elusimicrobiota bacterium]